MILKKLQVRIRERKKKEEEEVSVANCIGLATCSNTDA